MSRTGRKSEDMRHVSFRMLAEAHEDYIEVARSRGVDLSALLNWALVEFWPLLLLRHAEHKAAMLRASLPGLSLGTAEPMQQQSLEKINGLIGQLQDVAGKLSANVGGGDRRQAS